MGQAANDTVARLQVLRAGLAEERFDDAGGKGRVRPMTRPEVAKSVAEELRAFDWQGQAPYKSLSTTAYLVLTAVRSPPMFTSDESIGWFYVHPITCAEIMTEAIEAAEALGL